MYSQSIKAFRDLTIGKKEPASLQNVGGATHLPAYALNNAWSRIFALAACSLNPAGLQNVNSSCPGVSLCMNNINTS